MTQKQLSIPATEQPNVQIIDGKATTTSLDVAKFFDKRHDNVARDIQKLAKDEPEWCALNFEETSHLVPQPNGGTREEIIYTMSRDGFTFVVMGYTGEKARKFKIAYINKFNEMEARLYAQPEQLKLDALSTKDDRKPLVNLINTFVGCAPVTYRDAWHMVHAHMGGKHAPDFTLAEVQKACEFVQSKIDMATAPAPALEPFTPSDEYVAIDNEVKQLYGQFDPNTMWGDLGLNKDESTLGLIFSMKGYFADTVRLAKNYEKVLTELKRLEADCLKIRLIQKMMV